MSTPNDKPLRADHREIAKLIEPNSRVLDLGCGDGALLAHVTAERQVNGTGIEIDEQAIYKCMEKGITVSHGDIDSGLADYSSNRFDYVILNESLQEVLHPQKVLLEALRVGKRAVIGIPNFCHLGARIQIFFSGRVPVTKELPYEWYDTPNLRFLSLKDFRTFCKENNVRIIKEVGIAGNRAVTFWPNLFAQMGLFLLEK